MVNSVLYDRMEDGKSRLIVEIMHPTGEAGGQSGGGGGEKTSSLILVCQGESMPEAIRDETKSIDKVLFGGLNKARLFTERLAKKGVAPIVDYLSRDHLTDETPLVIMVQDENPDRIYKCSTGLSSMLGDYLETLSNTQHLSTCQSVFVTTLAFAKDYYDDGKQPVMGVVKIIKNELEKSDSGEQKSSNGGSSSGGQESESEKDMIRYEGLAAFKDDQLAGYMNGAEARVYNIITGHFTVDTITIPSGEDYTTCMLRSTKVKVDTKINQDKQAEINIEMKAVLSLIQETGDIDISRTDALKKMEQDVNALLAKQVEGAIKKAQEFESDIFGFGRYVHSQHPKEWKEIKKDWDSIFAKAKINVTVKSSIIREGEIKMPFALKEKTDE
jgi:spore germination protein KC